MTTAAETRWGPGPWQNEPDHEAWTDEDTGLECLAVRGVGGSWCGYVEVPASHPWHGTSYMDLPDVQVHYGLTYSEQGNNRAGHGKERAGQWWLGFDCAHTGDLSPQEIVNDEYGLREGIYRDLRFVRRECSELAEQIKEAR